MKSRDFRSSSDVDDGLLVDFPRNARLPSSSTSSCISSDASSLPSPMPLSEESKAKKKATKKSVRFCKRSTLVIVEYPSSSELRRRWNTQDEQDDFKRRLLRDRNVISRKLRTSQIETDDLIICIGMEKLLSPELCRSVKQRQKQHVRSILEEQERKDSCNIVDEEAIARLSRANSKWTRARSHQLAKGYWANLKDEEQEEESKDVQQNSKKLA